MEFGFTTACSLNVLQDHQIIINNIITITITLIKKVIKDTKVGLENKLKKLFTCFVYHKGCIR